MVIHNYYARIYGSRFLLQLYHAWRHSSLTKMMLLILFFFHSFGDIVVFDLAGELLFTIPQVSAPLPKKPQYFVIVLHSCTYIHSYITAFTHSQTTNRVVNEAFKMIPPGERGKSVKDCVLPEPIRLQDLDYSTCLQTHWEKINTFIWWSWLVKGETKRLNVIWTCNTFLLVTVNLLFNKCFFPDHWSSSFRFKWLYIWTCFRWAQAELSVVRC